MCYNPDHPARCLCHLTDEQIIKYYGSMPFGISRYYNNYNAYVTPNAICPVCKAYVFFVQAHSGAMVFLDECGPPWPMHRCQASPIQLWPRNSISINSIVENTQPDWMNNKWLPAIIKHKTHQGTSVGMCEVKYFHPDFLGPLEFKANVSSKFNLLGFELFHLQRPNHSTKKYLQEKNNKYIVSGFGEFNGEFNNFIIKLFDSPLEAERQPWMMEK